jgi:hypothetical protein
MYTGVGKGWTEIKEESFGEDGDERRSHCTRGPMLRETSMKNYADFEVPTAVVMKISVFWDVLPCSPVKVNFYHTT